MQAYLGLGVCLMSFDFNLEPKEAIEFLQNKHKELHFDYDEILHEAHLKAFTIAKITQLDLLKDIQDSIVKAIKEGKSFEVWKREITPTLSQKGWLGNIEVKNPKSGESKQIFIGSRRLKNIYYTNLRTAYAQARARAQYELSGEMYLRYVALLDGLTRPSHARLHGLILPREDKFWERNYPPNAWNCRCRVQAYTKKALQKQGWEVAKNPPEFVAHKDWDYDTRNLKRDSKDLEKILQNKLESYQGNPAMQEAIKELKEDCKQARENYSNIKELKAKALQGIVDNESLSIAKTTRALREILNTKAKEIYLSGWTLRTHTHHQNVEEWDYSLLPFLVREANVYKVKCNGDKHIIYFSKFGSYYRIVLKLRNKEEGFLQTLVKGSKKIEK